MPKLYSPKRQDSAPGAPTVSQADSAEPFGAPQAPSQAQSQMQAKLQASAKRKGGSRHPPMNVQRSMAQRFRRSSATGSTAGGSAIGGGAAGSAGG